MSDKHYHEVWAFDGNDANHTMFNVESINSVVNRTSALILDIENELNDLKEKRSQVGNDNDEKDKPIKAILVAHGDVLQILQTAFLKKPATVHRSLEHLETACVREYILQE